MLSSSGGIIVVVVDVRMCNSVAMYMLIHTRKTNAVGRSLPLLLHVYCAVYDGVLAGLVTVAG